MDSSKESIPKWDQIHTIAFDFDGVFTNNKVIVHQDSSESVICDRSDGLGFDILRKFIKLKNWNLDFFIISKEKNCVVKERAKKMQINCYQGVDNKLNFIKQRLSKNKMDKTLNKKIIYVGNDLNDLESMIFADFAVSPKDAHQKVKENSDLVIDLNGGDGFLRKFIEIIIELNKMTISELMYLIN